MERERNPGELLPRRYFAPVVESDRANISKLTAISSRSIKAAISPVATTAGTHNGRFDHTAASSIHPHSSVQRTFSICGFSPCRPARQTKASRPGPTGDWHAASQSRREGSSQPGRQLGEPDRFTAAIMVLSRPAYSMIIVCGAQSDFRQ